MPTAAQKVVNDTPSEVVDEIRRQFNALLDLLESAADLGAIQTGLGDAVGTSKRVTVTPEPPEAPKFP